MAHPDTINALIINNAGGGFADRKSYNKGITAKEVVQKEVNGNYQDHTIRVNGKEVAEDYVMENGDTLTVTPLKIKGA